jgi:hypothetical protein
MSAVEAVEAEPASSSAGGGLDPVTDRQALRPLVDEVVSHYDERAMTSALAPLPGPRQAARTVPALKARSPLPRSSRSRMPGSLSARSQASRRASYMAGVIAFCRAGWWRPGGGALDELDELGAVLVPGARGAEPVVVEKGTEVERGAERGPGGRGDGPRP